MISLLIVSTIPLFGIIAQEQSKHQFRFDGAYQHNWTGAGYQGFGLSAPYPTNNFVSFRFIDGSHENATFGLSYLYSLSEQLRIGIRLGSDGRDSRLIDYSLEQKPQIDLTMGYITFEPTIEYGVSKRVSLQFRPILAFNIDAVFDYTYPQLPPLRGNTLQDVPTLSYGFAIGTNYSIPLDKKQKWNVLPFIEGSWLFNQRTANTGINQNPLTDVLSTLSLRVGAAISFSLTESEEEYIPEPPRQNPFIGLTFSIPPNGWIRTRATEEYFPLSNDIYFDAGSSKIPNRYAQLTPESAKRFDEDNIGNVNYGSGINRQGRISSEANAYYHSLNIYASRLRKNPSLTLKLIGHGSTADESLTLAKNIKEYLVQSHGIAPNRLFVESAINDDPNQKKSLAVRQKKVEIVPGLPSANSPVILKMVENSPIDNDIVIALEERDNIAKWSLKVTGEKTETPFGPYTELTQRIEPTLILGTKPNGYFNATVTATKKDGSVQTAEKEFKLDRKRIEGMGRRYTLLFNGKETILEDDKYLRNKIAALVTDKESIIIHTHTDDEGSDKDNMILSKKRAEYIKGIIGEEIKKRGLSVSIHIIALGEDTTYSMASNSLPEGKQYNNSAVIEIIPIEK